MAGDDLKTKEQERDHSAFALNRLLNRELHAPWPRVAVPVPPASDLLHRAAGRRRARGGAPAQGDAPGKHLGAGRGRLDPPSAPARRERRNRGAAIQRRRRPSGRDGHRQLQRPLAQPGKYDDDWRRDQQRKRASDFAAADRALSVREELHHHVVALDAARREAVLYRDQLIPLTQQTLSSAQASWEHNLGPFQDILDAHRRSWRTSWQWPMPWSTRGRCSRSSPCSPVAAIWAPVLALAGNPPPEHDEPIPDNTK
jgi:hypothetical protein